MIETDLRALLARQLAPGEKLLWSGQSDPAVVFGAYLGCWVLGVPWTAISFFLVPDFIETLLTRGGPLFPILFIALFVTLSLAMLSAPFWMARRERRTIYGITDRRLLALVAGRRPNLRSTEGMGIGSIAADAWGDGRGNLHVKAHSPFDSYGGRDTASFSLHGIADARQVERLLRALPQE